MWESSSIVSDNLSLWQSYRRALLRPAVRPEQALLLAPLQRQAELASNPQQLLSYRQLCQLTPSDQLPPCWLSVLSFPLQLSLLTDPALPLPAMGLLHIRNQIRQWRPLPTKAKWQLQATLDTPQVYAKGVLLTINTVAYLQNELCWQQQAEYLYRTASTMSAAAIPTALPADPILSLPALSQLSLAPALSRRYAWLSGDLNPIHLSALSARCFGLPAALAHGMHLKALILGRLAPTIEAYKVDVNFSRPFYLPGQAQLSSALLDNGQQPFRLMQGAQQKPVLSGDILPI